MQEQKKLLTSVWMNTFCHTVCGILHVCAVEQTILWDSWHSLAYFFQLG